VNPILLTVISALSGVAALATLIWAVFRERHKPALDREEMQNITDERNRDRDIWMRRLDRYLFDDANWHRAVVRLFQRLQDEGFIPEDIEIPTPPSVPEPPPYGPSNAA
jgi:hypothetical protein